MMNVIVLNFYYRRYSIVADFILFLFIIPWVTYYPIKRREMCERLFSLKYKKRFSKFLKWEEFIIAEIKCRALDHPALKKNYIIL